MENSPNELREIQISYSSNRQNNESEKIITSENAYNKLLQSFDKNTIDCQEEFMVIMLNRNNVPNGVFKVSRGGISATVVDVRLIVATALKSLSTSIILAHNHPSGNINPSDMDKYMTNRIKQACEFMEITLLDHIIVTSQNGYFSFADNGIL